MEASISDSELFDKADRDVLLDALREIRDRSVSHADAVAMAKRTLAMAGVAPEPEFRDVPAVLLEHLRSGEPPAALAVIDQVVRGLDAIATIEAETMVLAPVVAIDSKPPSVPCSGCGGSGRVRHSSKSDPMWWEFEERRCGYCQGAGRVLARGSTA